jgi:hypothetical protein
MKQNSVTKEYHAAQHEVDEAIRRVRDANDVLADAYSALKAANHRLRTAIRSPTAPDKES